MALTNICAESIRNKLFTVGNEWGKKTSVALTVAQAIDLFMTSMVSEGKSAKTIKWYRQMLASLRARWGENSLDAITTDDLRVWLAERSTNQTLYEGHGYRPAVTGARSVYTHHGYSRAARRFFAWCVEEKKIASSPAKSIKLPRLPKKRAPKAAELSDISAMIDVAAKTNPMAAAMLAIICSSGCRVGGVTHLRRRDLSLDLSEAQVTEKFNKQRAIYLDECARDYLQRYLAEHPCWPDDFIFPGRHKGKPMKCESVWHLFERIAEAAGVTGRFNPHAMRHLFSREWLMSGGDLKSLSETLGHASVVVTADIYSNYTENHLKQKHQSHAVLLKKAAPKPDETPTVKGP